MPLGDSTSPEMEHIATQVVDAAFKVHQEIGPGVLESAYELCLAHELRMRGLRVERQVELPIKYDNVLIESGYRLDLVVEGLIIVEIKAIEKLHPVHEAQCLTYLKFSGLRVCILINFNVKLFKDGIKRIVR